MPLTTAEKAQYWLFKDHIPVTKLLIVANVAFLFIIGLFKLGGLFGLLTYDANFTLQAPWTLFTYPLIPYIGGAGSIINLLFAGYWLWVAGGSLERAWGSTRFAIFFFVVSAISALGLFAGAVVTQVLTGQIVQGLGAAGLWLPLAGVTVAFGMMNPEQVILFMLFIPMKLKFLALLDVVLLFFSYISYPIFVPVLSLAGCAFAFWYVRSGSRLSYSQARPARQPRPQVVRVYPRKSFFGRLNPFVWFREYRERRKLRDFFDKSGFKD